MSKPSPRAIEAFRAITEPLPDDARMDGYYIGFERTGVGAIDAILSAIAHAAKAYHHTESWGDDWFGRGDLLPHGGDSAVEAIQNAANAAARAIENAVDWWEADQ